MEKLPENNILYEDNHIIVVNKPINVPVQEDSSKDIDLLTLIKNYLKVKYNKPGNVYLGLVHRLDRPVGGVMVFAKTSKAASRLSEEVRTNKIKKTYYAVVHGKVNNKGHLEDYLYKDNKTNTSYVVNKDKGKKSGESRIRNNAAEKLKGYCKGQIITTKELKEHGYNNSDAIKRITGVIIEKVGHGKYKMLIDIPS